ncbi:helix-turn-helix domain-containing protein [Bradyrhizobium sp. AUGA SZCCT0240]|uniref:helix-turn-helix domain-containing protein n=1 Tax=unclassified Bradyrhizobium TaxID=2631580 RepID=UPI001BA6424C|nr:MULTISPECIES: helix-turn-helix transcriptional regulator [unclassified Bradyrhizobium]MBR1200936.1 helix-turn-helix domain-containing protein [Bradyrhizobium sp. AUGA SZCCT0158]MBR1258742.1 helix-turn-helix domain-containing protein [Bradyrhizobium sp. AUGA SZCCT0240]
MFSPSQLRAARALVGWSQSEIANAAGLSVPTIKRAEADGGIKVSEEAVAAIASVLKKVGVEFIEENGGGVGVRLRKAQSPARLK